MTNILTVRTAPPGVGLSVKVRGANSLAVLGKNSVKPRNWGPRGVSYVYVHEAKTGKGNRLFLSERM